MATEVTIAELKNHLSRYLRSVRQGHEIVVKNRDEPVARLVPYNSSPRFQIIKPTRSPKDLQRLLRKMRPTKLDISDKEIDEVVRWVKRDVWDKPDFWKALEDDKLL